MVDDEDHEKVTGYRWFRSGSGFVAWTEDGPKSLISVLGVGRVTHKDGNMFNWQRENLEPLVKPKTSRYKGVSYNAARDRWFAQLKIRGKNYVRGPFQTEEEARDARIELVQMHLNRT